MTESARPVLVTGMHRSGTSAVAGALRAAGLYVGTGAELFGPSPDNPTGFVERRDVVAFDNRLLESLGWHWDTPPAEPTAMQVVGASVIDEAHQLLRGAFAKRTRWLMKDPRLCLLLPTWRRVLNDQLVAVVVMRPVEEVALSLWTRDGFPIELGAGLWAAYMRHLASGLEGLSTVVVQYSGLTEDPAKTVGEMLAGLEQLGVPGPFDRASAVASIEPELRHSAAGTRVSSTAGIEPSIQALAKAWPVAPVAIYERFSMPIEPSSEREQAILAAHVRERSTPLIAAAGGSRTIPSARRRLSRRAGSVALRRLRYRVALRLPWSLYSNPLFDAAWYLDRYADVAASGVSPYRHYRLTGAREGRNPNAWFDTDWYLRTNPDVVRSGMHPLDHYLLHGGRERRRPSERFDPAIYLSQNPDVASSGLDPLLHYLRHGRAEGREVPHARAVDPVPQPDRPHTDPRGESPTLGIPPASLGYDVVTSGAGREMVARLIAFYLPQFYPTAENDRWWGPGFTEWTNVASAKPLFPGHEQPQLPADLGFYDLRVPEVRQQQADLAAAHGIEAFCYWHYWFHGRRLLERPFAETLTSGQPSFPFCLAWANESWSRRWHGSGGEAEILIAQTYSDADDLAHAHWLAEAFADPRYLRVAGRPLLLVYRPYSLPNPQRTADTLRSIAVRAGLSEPYLVGINAHNPAVDARSVGFDSTLDFAPQLGALADIGRAGLKTYDYLDSVRRLRRTPRSYPHHPTVFVSWDNTPRKGGEGIVLTGCNPPAFERSLGSVLDAVQLQPQQSRLVFLNAWNEWAEGNHLEPDVRHGMGWLEAVHRQVLRPMNASVTPATRP